MLPAHIDHDARLAHVVYAGNHHRLTEYVFVRGLDADAVEWTPSANGEILPLAVVGGRTERSEALYFGRHLQADATDAPKWLLGKVHPSHGVLYVNVNDVETPFTEYEILVRRDVGRE